MDLLTALLDAPRARGAVLSRVAMTPPWIVRLRNDAPLTVVAVTAGTACFVPEEEPVHLAAGDLLLITRPLLLGDGPDRAGRSDPAPATEFRLGGHRESSSGPGQQLPTARGECPRGDATGRDALLVGSYPRVSEACSRLLRALPPAILVRAADHRSGLIDVLAEEIDSEGTGQGSVLDRLLDSLTVTAIRHWAASAGAEPAGWFRVAGTDPVVSAALDLMHEQTAHPWTVASLARRVGMSRAGFSRRFAAVVGESPMAYLAAWRLAVAADLLRHDDVPISHVAREVGYASPFTFSTAFKRQHGVSPLAYRQQDHPFGIGSPAGSNPPTSTTA